MEIEVSKEVAPAYVAHVLPILQNAICLGLRIRIGLDFRGMIKTHQTRGIQSMIAEIVGNAVLL